MRKTLLSVVATLLVCLFFLTACQRHTGFRRLLSEADSLMRVDPDSAFRLLCRLDSAAESLPQSLRMQTLLLRCNAQNKADSLFENDSLGLLLTDYFDRKGTPNQRMLAHYILGCAYRDLDDRPAAIRCFNDAVAAADTTANDCDIRQISIIYGQIGGIYNDLCLADESLEAYRMAELFAERSKDSLLLFLFWANKSRSYIYKGKIAEALEIKERAAKGLEALGKYNYAAQTRGGCIKWLLINKQFDKAKAYLDDFISHSGYVLPNGEPKPGHLGCYYFKGLYYLETGQRDSASHYLYKYYNQSPDLDERYNATWCLSRLYAIYNQPDSIAKYSYLGDFLGDTIQTVNNAKNFQLFQAIYNYSQHQQEALRYKLRSQRTLLLLIISSIITVLVIFLIIFTTRQYRRRMKRQDKVHESYQQQANETITQQQGQILKYEKEREKLKQDVEDKTSIINQLGEQIQSHKKEIVDLQLCLENNELNQKQLEEQLKLLEGLHQQMTEFKQQQQKIASINKRTKLFDTPPIARLIELANKRTEQPTPTEWNAVFEEIEKAFPSFNSLLEYHNIDDLDFKICVLIKLKFNVTDIVYLTNVNNNLIATRRRRLYKKLTNVEGTTKDFDELIHHYPESSPTDNHNSSDEMIIQ